MVRKTTGRYRLPRCFGNEFRCPRCYAEVHWVCRGYKEGSKGHAYCSKSIHASQIWSYSSDKEDLDFCIWQGEVIRLSNGFIEIWDDLSWTDFPLGYE